MQRPTTGPAAIPPRISIRGARAAYIGPGLELAPHSNAVATVAIAIEAPFRLALATAASAPPAAAYASTLVALIRPGTHHHLIAGGPMVFVYLDAVHDDVSWLERRELSPERDAVAAAARDHRCDVDVLLARLGVPARATPPANVQRAIDAIHARPQELRRLADAAILAGLSDSRFRHVLRERTGLTFRRYRRWRRMALVMRELAAGRSLTTAAHAAGFASSAHLSAAFKAMFGLRPSDLERLGVTFDLDVDHRAAS